jgi:hypothetical protein
VLQFPLGLTRGVQSPPELLRPTAQSALPAFLSPDNPPLQKFHADNIRNLSGICRRVLDGTQEIISYVDGNREDAKAAGIEALAAELSSILEGGRLQDLQDHLDYALARNKDADLTLENLSRLNRAERLLSEASKALAFAIVPPGMSSGRFLGAAAPAPARDSLETILVVALAATAVMAIIFLGNGRN